MARKSWSQVDNEDGAQEGVEQAQIEERKRLKEIERRREAEREAAEDARIKRELAEMQRAYELDNLKSQQKPSNRQPAAALRPPRPGRAARDAQLYRPARARLLPARVGHRAELQPRGLSAAKAAIHRRSGLSEPRADHPRRFFDR